MYVWNKVLMALVALVCVVFAILASNKYQLTKTKESEIAKLQADLERVDGEIAALRYEIYGGSPDKTAENWTEYGLDEQLKYVRALQRGDAFLNCKPVEARIDKEAGSSSLSFIVDEQYQTSPFRTGAIAYVFDSGKAVEQKSGEDGEDGEAAAASDEDDATEVATAAEPFVFLGAYVVSGAADRQVKLESIGTASSEELENLNRSKSSGNAWVAYVNDLPIDSPSDAAYFAQKYSEQTLGLSDESRAFLNKKFSVEDAAQSITQQDGELALADLSASDTTRYPIDFQGAVKRFWSLRDAANVSAARKKEAKNVLTSVIADQFVMIGKEVVDAEALDFEDWETFYQQAKDRKKSPSLTEQLAERAAARDKMIGYRDLVKSKLDESREIIGELEDSISALISENAKIAAKIANAQFSLMEKIEQENAAKTASTDANLSLNDI